MIIGRHQMFSAASLHNTYTALVLPGLAMPFGVFLMTQYFRAIPKELDEAALLDGASRLADLLADPAAAHHSGAGHAGHLHVLPCLERLLVAADQRDRQGHADADRRHRRDPDELRADRGARLPDGAGRLRRRCRHCWSTWCSRSTSCARSREPPGNEAPCSRCCRWPLLAACGRPDGRTELVIQRFFGACQAEYGTLADPAKAER